MSQFISVRAARMLHKAQYELLEAELADFQSSSRELETEMEKDIEASGICSTSTMLAPAQ
jgi:hypothetical protein